MSNLQAISMPIALNSSGTRYSTTDNLGSSNYLQRVRLRFIRQSQWFGNSSRLDASNDLSVRHLTLPRVN